MIVTKNKKVVIATTLGKNDEVTCYEEQQHRCSHGDCQREVECSEMQHISVKVGELGCGFFVCVDCIESFNDRLEYVYSKYELH